MPTTNNITVSPNSGTGARTLTVSALENTGRNSRSANFSLAGTGDYSSVLSSNSLVVTQSGVSGFITITTTSDTTAFHAAGGTLTYTGYSNLASISIGTGTLDNCLTSATINGVSGITKSQLQSGYTVPNDPGASEKYAVTFVYTIPANQSTSGTVTYSGTIGGQQYTVIQSARQVTLSFSSNTAEVNSSGTLVGDSISVIAPEGVSWVISTE